MSAPHILVVDDDARLCRLLSQYLTENGYLVATAADAREARQQLAAIARRPGQSRSGRSSTRVRAASLGMRPRLQLPDPLIVTAIFIAAQDPARCGRPLAGRLH